VLVPLLQALTPLSTHPTNTATDTKSKRNAITKVETGEAKEAVKWKLEGLVSGMCMCTYSTITVTLTP
jgi:hypothetical protein